MVRVAKRVGLAMTGFSLLVAPLLQFAAEGLWQVIRIFTGFYNIPMIAIVIIGLFTRQVPAVAAKVVIVFHIVAYGTFQFVLKDLLPVHFLHLYAILFVLEVAMMLAIGAWRPQKEETSIRQTAEVDLTPWAYALPCAVTLLSCVVALYVVFSPVGLVGGGSDLFAPVLLGVLALNVLFWLGWHRRLSSASGVRA
jgi:SSS family solute:Na+ symporter